MTLNKLREKYPIGTVAETSEIDYFEVATEVNSFEEIDAIEAREDYLPEDALCEYPYTTNVFSKGFPMTFHWVRQQNHLITVRGYATFENDEIAYLIDIDKEWYSPKDEK